MDERPTHPDEPERSCDQLRWSPDRRYTLLAAIGALAAAGALALAGDGPGRLFAALVALVLAGYVVSDLVFAPRLVASPDGLVVRAPFTLARLDWGEVEHVRADTRLRHGLRSTTLEIDAGAVLVVLSRRALDEEPERVAELVNALRPPR